AAWRMSVVICSGTILPVAGSIGETGSVCGPPALVGKPGGAVGPEGPRRAWRRAVLAEGVVSGVAAPLPLEAGGREQRVSRQQLCCRIGSMTRSKYVDEAGSSPDLHDAFERAPSSPHAHAVATTARET